MKHFQSLKATFLAVILTVSISIQAANDKKSVTQVNETVTITTATDYTVTSDTPFGNNGVVNIENTDKAVLILAAVKPSAALKLLSAHVQIAGNAASNGKNCQVKLYNRGCIILPYGDSTNPLTVYSEKDFGGTAVNDFGLENTNGFMNTLTDEKLNNKIRSFKLKRGYMVTFSLRAGGYGYSRCFIADDADLEMAELPNELDCKISSYRIFKWFDTGKQQLAGADNDYAACGALNVTSTYGWGVGSDMGPDVESVPHHIKENWPTAAELGRATWSPHMKTNNEPRNPADDSPCDLNAILSNWEALMATGMRLCSPSSWDGSDYWNGTGFLRDFFNEIDARGWRCDIIDLHGYWEEGSFGNSIPNWYNAVGRPVWVSEWVWGASWNSNGAFASGVTEAQNAAAVKRICEKMNSLPYVERYYYWNSERDPSKIYKNGTLTAAGQYYATINSGVGYNQKYTYVPNAVVRVPVLAAQFTESTGTTKLSWREYSGELTKQMTLERRTTAAPEWKTLETFEVGENPKTFTYTDTESGYGCDYRVHIVDFKGRDVYSDVYSLLNDEEVYLYNVGAGQWLTGANNYGTKASLTPYGGLNVTMLTDDGGNSIIETGINRDANNHYLNVDGTSAWVDQAMGKWNVTAVGDVDGRPAYTLSINGQNLQYDGTGSALVFGTGTDANAQWLKVTESERLSKLANATGAKPVDATFLIPGAQFSIYDSRNDNWQGSPSLGGKSENRCAEKYNTTFDVFQTTTSALPVGRYRLSLQGFYRNGGYAAAATKHNNGNESLNATFYAGTTELPLQSIFTEAGKMDVGKTTSGISGKFPDSMNDASDFFSGGYYDNSLNFIVKKSTAIKVGVKKTEAVGSDWTIFDNFRLEYLGDFSSATLSTQAIDGHYWATFFCSVCAYELPAGATAYVATRDGTTLTLRSIGSVVPGGCAVIIVSEHAGDLLLSRTTYSLDDDMKAIVSTNILRANDNDIKTSTYKYPYSLGSKDGKCAFLPHTTIAIPSERAFVTLQSAVDALPVVFDNSSVDIRTVTDRAVDTPVRLFDLQGRRVSGLNKGVYIQNGKKVIKR